MTHKRLFIPGAIEWEKKNTVVLVSRHRLYIEGYIDPSQYRMKNDRNKTVSVRNGGYIYEESQLTGTYFILAYPPFSRPTLP